MTGLKIFNTLSSVKKLLHLFTIFLLVLSVGLFNSAVQNLNYVTSTVSSDLTDTSDHNESENEEETFNVNLYEEECLIHQQQLIFTPKIKNIAFEDNLPVLIPSYMFSIFIPPLATRVS